MADEKAMRFLAWGDIALVALAALGVVVRDALPQPLRGLAAVVLIVWGIGHLAFEAAWPQGAARVHGRIERQAFAVGLSLTITPIVAVILHLTGALSPANLQWAIAVLTLVFLVVAVVRRRRADPTPYPDEEVTLRHAPLTRRERTLTAIAGSLGLAALLVVGVQVASLAEPAPTTLRLTDLDGALPPHPFNATVGEAGAVLVYVSSGVSQSYQVTATFAGSEPFERRIGPVEAGLEAAVEIPIPARSTPGTAWLAIEAVGETTHETRSLRLLVQFQEGSA